MFVGKGLTDCSHFFAGDKRVGFLNVRKVACLNCAACCTGNFSAEHCENRKMCGEIYRPQVHLASGAREDAPQTRYSVTENGKKLAQAVRVNEIVGAECANETEPYILFKALTTAYEVTTVMYSSMKLEYKHNWMGEVLPGDMIIKGLKLDRRAGDLYTETPKVFYLFAEDTRGVVKAAPLQRKKSLRANKVQSEIVIYEIDEGSLNAIKKTVFLPEPYKPKRPHVPRS